MRYVTQSLLLCRQIAASCGAAERQVSSTLNFDYDQLLDLAAELGFRLMETGAEIYRVEESVQYILQAYGVTTGEVFAIPNCLIISFTDTTGHAHTRVRRIPAHGTDISLLESLNEYCRETVQDPPPLAAALDRLDQIQKRHFVYPLPVMLLADFAGGGAYSMFFGGSLRDALCGGLCGVAIGLCLWLMGGLRANSFVRTLAGGAVSALCALLLVQSGLGENLDFIIIGALMILVPGIAFTNAMRDIMSGDLTSGVNKTVEALLIATAIALGTGFVLTLAPAL